MKYKLLKDLPWAKAGTIVEADFTRSGNGNISYSFVAEWGRGKGQRVFYGWYPYMYDTFSDWFEEVDERWKPKVDEIYFFVEAEGSVEHLKWDMYSTDEERWKIGNCFKEKVEAERAAEQIKALLKEFHKNNP